MTPVNLSDKTNQIVGQINDLTIELVIAMGKAEHIAYKQGGELPSDFKDIKTGHYKNYNEELFSFENYTLKALNALQNPPSAPREQKILFKKLFPGAQRTPKTLDEAITLTLQHAKLNLSNLKQYHQNVLNALTDKGFMLSIALVLGAFGAASYFATKAVSNFTSSSQGPTA